MLTKGIFSVVGAGLFGVLFFCPTDVSSIYCFQCNSKTDEACLDIAPNNTMSPYYKECVYKPNGDQPSSAEMFCRKIYQKIHDRDGLVRVIRKCGWVMDDRKKDCYSLSNYGHIEIVCQCFQDGCNSAVTTSVSTFAALSSILIAILYH